MPSAGLLMITRRSTSGDVEAEPVTVEATDYSVKVTLDDGETLTFDLYQLATAIEGKARQVGAA